MSFNYEVRFHVEALFDSPDHVLAAFFKQIRGRKPLNASGDIVISEIRIVPAGAEEGMETEP